jgi:hypothetical protein
VRLSSSPLLHFSHSLLLPPVGARAVRRRSSERVALPERRVGRSGSHQGPPGRRAVRERESESKRLKREGKEERERRKRREDKNQPTLFSFPRLVPNPSFPSQVLLESSAVRSVSGDVRLAVACVQERPQVRGAHALSRRVH